MKVRGLLLTVLLLLSAGLLSATNVALNAPVTVNGSLLTTDPNYACNGTPAAASVVDDGVFYNETHCWIDGAAWLGLSTSIDINFGSAFVISSAIVQADDNDTYELQYKGTDNAYHDWWAIWSIPSTGLVTRPNADQVTQEPLSTVVATGVRIFATGGDDHYAVGEVQVFGAPVGAPEPGSLLLLGAALPGLAVLRRLRK